METVLKNTHAHIHTQLKIKPFFLPKRMRPANCQNFILLTAICKFGADIKNTLGHEEEAIYDEEKDRETV